MNVTFIFDARKTTRRFEVDVGHRIVEFAGLCRHVTGARYTFEVTVQVQAAMVEEAHRVLDSVIGGWLHDRFAQSFVVREDDTLIPVLQASNDKTIVIDCEPTLENLSMIVFDGCVEQLALYEVRVVNVRGYKTPILWVDYGGAARDECPT